MLVAQTVWQGVDFGITSQVCSGGLDLVRDMDQHVSFCLDFDVQNNIP